MARNSDTRSTCENGHPMDPTWVQCPYCSPQQQQAAPPPTPPPVRRPTAVDPGQSPPTGRRLTTPEGSEPVTMEHRIVGVLVTYSRKREGEIFAVREGKNFIGRDDDCQVSIPEDRKMSGQHALILWQGGDLSVSDRDSSNGTFLNGKKVRSAVDLPDVAALQTGQMKWKFFRMDTEDVSEDEPVVHSERKPEPAGRRVTRVAE
jgi:hypothetical protein